jgi:hypothetical protein
MSSAGADLLQRALDPADLIEVLERSAASWDVAAGPVQVRPSCGLCLADRAWIAGSPVLEALPHGVTHALVARFDAALQAAEFDAHEYAEEDAYMHGRASDTIDAEIAATMRAFDERARETVLAVLDEIEPAVARVRETVVEPIVARYLASHTMTEPPWPWTLE